MADIHDLYDDVTTGGTGEYVLEHGGAEYTFEIRALQRTRKNEVLASLPEGFLDPTGLPDGLDPDEIKREEKIQIAQQLRVNEDVDVSGAEIGEIVGRSDAWVYNNTKPADELAN